MKKGRSSITAGVVAASRTLGELLPAGARLAHDPYGVHFTTGWVRRLADRRALTSIPPVEAFLIYMQLRTRALDDVLLDFAGSGGAQVVLLGAGYDCRAHRFGDRTRGVTFFEVDHPATQARKREVIASVAAGSPVRYLDWDFEARPVSELPHALAGAGLEREQRTLTIWEGVTMYLAEETIAASVDAVHAYSAPGSLLALTYFERRRILEQPRLIHRVVRAAVRSFGEPWTFGWDPGELGPWIATHGFELVSDETEASLAARLLPETQARKVKAAGRHVAVARALATEPDRR